MIEHLITLVMFMHSPQTWKMKVYEKKYGQTIQHYIHKPDPANYGSISWYGTGTPGFYTACWSDYPKGTKFKVTYGSNSVITICDDRGHFRELGRVLDLSKESFEQLAPLSTGIIREAKVEVIR